MVESKRDYRNNIIELTLAAGTVGLGVLTAITLGEQLHHIFLPVKKVIAFDIGANNPNYPANEKPLIFHPQKPDPNFYR